MKSTRLSIATIAAAASIATVGFAAPSFAQNDDVAPTPTEQSTPADTPAPEVPAPEADPADGTVTVDATGEGCEEWQPSADDIADINKETDELVKFLADKGITLDVETDDEGIRYPVYDETTEESTIELIDQFYTERYGADGLVEWEPNTEDIADINAQTDELVKFLADKGVTVDVHTDDDGLRFPAFDDSTPESTWDLIDEFYGDMDMGDDAEVLVTAVEAG